MYESTAFWIKQLPVMLRKENTLTKFEITTDRVLSKEYKREEVYHVRYFMLINSYAIEPKPKLLAFRIKQLSVMLRKESHFSIKKP